MRDLIGAASVFAAAVVGAGVTGTLLAELGVVHFFFGPSVAAALVLVVSACLWWCAAGWLAHRWSLNVVAAAVVSVSFSLVAMSCAWGNSQYDWTERRHLWSWVSPRYGLADWEPLVFVALANLAARAGWRLSSSRRSLPLGSGLESAGEV